MNNDSEERLAAWLAGALPPDEAAAFEAELAENPALAAKAREWQANDAFIAGAMLPIAEMPIDAAMLAKLGLAGPVADRTSTICRWEGTKPSRWTRSV